MSNNTVTQSEMYSAMFDLHTALREAYWSTPDEATGNQITALADACYSILIELSRSDIKSRMDDYKRLTQFFNQTNARLKKVKEDIDQIVHSVAITAKVVGCIEQVLKLATNFCM